MKEYQQLTLKYRPNDLSDVVGQDDVVTMLSNAIELDRIPKVSLFIGPAGVGKTSIARIWSKTMNCNSEHSPCNECSICESIGKGSNIDVLELNAADKRKIDDIREILSKMRFKPMSKYKIFILDECHMLSVEAWNALLKDLEEPPEYCLFVLCTTNPEKIPTTILSRCMTFQFHSVNYEIVTKRLEYICKEEQYEYDLNALNIISKEAHGGVRDAISSLEQIACFSNDDINMEVTTKILNIVNVEILSKLITALQTHDLDNAILMLQTFIESNIPLDKVFLQLQETYGQCLKDYFKSSKKDSRIYSKHELLVINKLFLEYESKLKFANDKYYIMINLFNDMTNVINDDINERLCALEEMIKSGKFKASGIDADRANRITRALYGKKQTTVESEKQVNKNSEDTVDEEIVDCMDFLREN